MRQIKRRWNLGEDELLHSQLIPGRTRQPFTQEEDDNIFKAHVKFSNQWAKITTLLPG
uniref:HTH myb-type domain-containing protein n=1 Tax=Solanum lycopersicum TaxID=4081 RepID=A0A3Q7J6Q1_SOLLC